MPATRSNPLGIRRPRAAIGALAAVAAGALVAVAFAGCGVVGPTPVSTIGKVDFDTPLAIPPLAESTIDADGTRIFALDAKAGTTEFAPGVPSDTWGFNGSYLGPTIVAKRGEHVRVDEVPRPRAAWRGADQEIGPRGQLDETGEIAIGGSGHRRPVVIADLHVEAARGALRKGMYS